VTENVRALFIIMFHAHIDWAKSKLDSEEVEFITKLCQVYNLEEKRSCLDDYPQWRNIIVPDEPNAESPEESQKNARSYWEQLFN